MKCPICDKPMAHSRLRGYYCFPSCESEKRRLWHEVEQGRMTFEEYEAKIEGKRKRRG